MTTAVELVQESSRVARVQFRTDNGVHVFSRETRDRLAVVLGELQQQDGLQVVVFESEGRTFIAGADIHELHALNAESAVAMAQAGQMLMKHIAALKPVTIAAVHAACAGGGCELALACDLRMAARGARIGLPEVLLGILPGWGGTVRAARLLGAAAARRIILCGDLLPAEEALRWGLVDSVADDDEFRNAVDARIELLLSCGPLAQQAVKRLLAEFEGPDPESQLEVEARAFGQCFATGESREGTRAFLDKRAPNWDDVQG
jgi:enoyl-CoA hydratase